MAIPQPLLDAYLRTNFQAQTPAGTLSIRCGHSHEQLDALLASHGHRTWAFISGCNPRSRVLTDGENADRHAALFAALRGRFTLHEGQGVSEGWAEPSFLVIGIGPKEATQIGRDLGQHAIVVGERYGPAELRDCWTFWADDPQLEFREPSDAKTVGDCYSRCPICGGAYRGAHHRVCSHVITDWCFTLYAEPGSSRGYWASDGTGHVLIGFEAELRRLCKVIDDREWPQRKGEEFLSRIPAHLGFIRGGAGAVGYDVLLCERLAASADYAGSARVTTDNPMVSDRWDVHWAHDGATAARAVDQLFLGDLTWLRNATILAAGLLRCDPSELGPSYGEATMNNDCDQGLKLDRPKSEKLI